MTERCGSMKTGSGTRNSSSFMTGYLLSTMSRTDTSTLTGGANSNGIENGRSSVTGSGSSRMTGNANSNVTGNSCSGATGNNSFRVTECSRPSATESANSVETGSCSVGSPGCASAPATGSGTTPAPDGRPRSKPRPATCPICQKVLSRNSHLNRHMHSVHGLEMDYHFQCPVCHKLFVSGTNARRHMLRFHAGTGLGSHAQGPGDPGTLQAGAPRLDPQQARPSPVCLEEFYNTQRCGEYMKLGSSVKMEETPPCDPIHADGTNQRTEATHTCPADGRVDPSLCRDASCLPTVCTVGRPCSSCQRGTRAGHVMERPEGVGQGTVCEKGSQRTDPCPGCIGEPSELQQHFSPSFHESRRERFLAHSAGTRGEGLMSGKEMPRREGHYRGRAWNERISPVARRRILETRDYRGARFVRNRFYRGRRNFDPRRRRARDYERKWRPRGVRPWGGSRLVNSPETKAFSWSKDSPSQTRGTNRQYRTSRERRFSPVGRGRHSASSPGAMESNSAMDQLRTSRKRAWEDPFGGNDHAYAARTVPQEAKDCKSVDRTGNLGQIEGTRLSNRYDVHKRSNYSPRREKPGLGMIKTEKARTDDNETTQKPEALGKIYALGGEAVTDLKGATGGLVRDPQQIDLHGAHSDPYKMFRTSPNTRTNGKMIRTRSDRELPRSGNNGEPRWSKVRGTCSSTRFSDTTTHDMRSEMCCEADIQGSFHPAKAKESFHYWREHGSYSNNIPQVTTSPTKDQLPGTDDNIETQELRWRGSCIQSQRDSNGMHPKTRDEEFHGLGKACRNSSTISERKHCLKTEMCEGNSWTGSNRSSNQLKSQGQPRDNGDFLARFGDTARSGVNRKLCCAKNDHEAFSGACTAPCRQGEAQATSASVENSGASDKISCIQGSILCCTEANQSLDRFGHTENSTHKASHRKAQENEVSSRHPLNRVHGSSYDTKINKNVDLVSLLDLDRNIRIREAGPCHTRDYETLSSSVDIDAAIDSQLVTARCASRETGNRCRQQLGKTGGHADSPKSSPRSKDTLWTRRSGRPSSCHSLVPGYSLEVSPNNQMMSVSTRNEKQGSLADAFCNCNARQARSEHKAEGNPRNEGTSKTRISRPEKHNMGSDEDQERVPTPDFPLKSDMPEWQGLYQAAAYCDEILAEWSPRDSERQAR